MPFFMKKAAAAALTAPLSLKWKSSLYSVKEGELTIECQVVNHFLETCTTDDIIAEIDSEIARYVQPSTVLRLKFEIELGIKKLRCPDVYEEYALKGIFVKSLLHSIRHSIRAYCSTKNCTFAKVGISHHVIDEAAISSNPRGANVRVQQSLHKSNNCQTNGSQGKINHVGSSNYMFL